MGRPAYKITKADWQAANEWITNQLQNLFWLDSDEKGKHLPSNRWQAEKAWKEIDQTDPESLQTWSEEWLRPRDWARMKTSIRVARSRAINHKKTINLDYEAWLDLSGRAEEWNLTLSETVLKLISMTKKRTTR